MKKAYLYLVAAMVVFAFSCKKENAGDCFKGVGNQTEQVRQLQPFDRILIDNNVDVVLVPDTAEFVIVRGGDNLIDLIKTDVVAGQLIIKNNNKCNWVRSFKTVISAEVHLKMITRLYFKGSGQITCTDTLRSPNFILEAYSASGDLDIVVRNGWNEVVQHTGNADLKVSGLAPYNTIYTGGNGFLDCRGMKSVEAYVLHKGTGNIYVRPDDLLDVKIELIGNVYYSGNCAVTESITSTGRLIKE